MSTPKTQKIDLSKCKVGQRVGLRNGKDETVREKVSKDAGAMAMHQINAGKWRWNDGRLDSAVTSPYDIVAILPLPKKAGEKKAKENTLDRFTSAFAKIAFKGDNDLIRKAADALEELLKL